MSRRTRRLVLAAIAAAVLVVGFQLAMMSHAARTQGTLALDCRTRCRFQGAECLPGGKLEMTLDPGTYTIDVWAASGSALWIPRTFDITAGERTAYACVQP